MKILISPTAFKGTLSPSQAADVMASEISRLYPAFKVLKKPLADGGDGTCDVLTGAAWGLKQKHRVTGPLGQAVMATWSFFKAGSLAPEKSAVIEMAEASGLKLVQGKNRIMDATSIGTGELIREALKKGCRTIFLGVGGTACSDGGAGALFSLGFRFLDQQGKSLFPSPQSLMRLHRIDRKAVDPALATAKIIVLCDVRNPLLGKNGSARVFGPQKGATREQVRELERFFKRWVKFADNRTEAHPGSGAAGGIAFGLSGFLKARLEPGTPFIMKAVHWNKAARQSDVIMTGEGCLDKTSFSGKVIGEILLRAKLKPVMAFCGSSPLSKRHWKKKGLSSVVVMGKAGLKQPRQQLAKVIKEALS